MNSLIENKLSSQKQYDYLKKRRAHIETELNEKLFPHFNKITKAEKAYREQVEAIL